MSQAIVKLIEVSDDKKYLKLLAERPDGVTKYGALCLVEGGTVANLCASLRALAHGLEKECS